MLSNQVITEILADWSYWDTLPKPSLPRKLELPKELVKDLVLFIQGVRRSGKSTLLSELPALYKIPYAQCFFCNFEDPRLMNHLNFELLETIKKIARTKFTNDIPCYFFFDEIQHVLEWEKWLHTQLERPKNNFYIVTGSNSKLLSGEFATALTGRHITLELFPFTFAEYKMSFANKTFEDYLLSGGFPRSLIFEKPYQLLQEYFNDIIYRDVCKRVNARSPESVKQVAKMTFESCGSELSFRKIAASTGLTVDTVKSYLEACQDAYLIFSCPYFSFSEKKQLSKHKKYYPVDSGLRFAITNTEGRDLGKSFELVVFLQLKKMHEKIFYWQEYQKGEVDFVGVTGNIITPYQVSLEGIKPRHGKMSEKNGICN